MVTESFFTPMTGVTSVPTCSAMYRPGSAITSASGKSSTIVLFIFSEHWEILDVNPPPMSSKYGLCP